MKYRVSNTKTVTTNTLSPFTEEACIPTREDEKVKREKAGTCSSCDFNNIRRTAPENLCLMQNQILLFWMNWILTSWILSSNKNRITIISCLFSRMTPCWWIRSSHNMREIQNFHLENLRKYFREKVQINSSFLILFGEH